MYYLSCISFISILLAISFPYGAVAENHQNKTKRPNILLVVLDDVGMTDLGSFGSEIKTPNIDNLANQGMKLNNFYTAPTCSPTRAMLLTGLDNHVVGLGNMYEELSPNQIGKAGYEGHLNNATISLPEILKQNGYSTHMAGKWHLGLDEKTSPAAQGFDNSYALLNGGGGHFNNLGLFGKPALYRENGKLVLLPNDFYSTKFYTDKLISYLETEKNNDAPFFAYLSYTSVHWPLQAPQKSIEKYKGKYHQGYEKLAEERLTKAVELGIFPKKSQLPPLLHGEPSWQGINDVQRKVEERNMEIYAAMLDDVDVYLGKLFDYLKSVNQFDNTLIFIMSDNGAEGHNIKHGLSELKPWIEDCCDNSYDNMGKANSYLLIGPNWTRASVGAARLSKGFTHEGGIRAPAIIKLPYLKEKSLNINRLLSNFISVKDVLPTILNVINIPKPQKKDTSHNVIEISGHDFLSEDKYIAEMGWELMGRKAYRFKNWKIVNAQPPYGSGNWELYHLGKDPLEMKNLAEINNVQLQLMIKKWQHYAKNEGVIIPDWLSGY